MQVREGFDHVPGSNTFALPRRRCRSCGMSFFPEEVRKGRFFPETCLCARCTLKGRVECGEVSLPKCFGGYDGSNLLCTRRCDAREGCFVEAIDLTATQWDVTPTSVGGSRQSSYREILVRALRTFGRPAHFMELAVALENATNGRWRRRESGRLWRHFIREALMGCPQALLIGDGFYVWSGLLEMKKDLTLFNRGK